MSRPADPVVILGSQSPRRRELLAYLLGSECVRVVVPQLIEEPGFGDVSTLEAIDARLLHVARVKHDDVAAQVHHQDTLSCIVAADTVIVAFDGAGQPVVLGKPPSDPATHHRTVRDWFERYYAGRRHLAKTAICVGAPGAPRHEIVTTTEVWFRSDAGEFIDWYLATNEPQGKAGGYAIQEAGSLFVERLVGSLSNVVGLPLAETSRLLRQAGVTNSHQS